ncbi:pyridoxamine 5'-phosphate oxidase family protein [Streptomyces mirabilis]|jgi:nitroimidazol reductase NimA-like FMN-containing flavoprotein (pyridoxamine 5'-phosphate oxidase superfamily)|uniref:pyridoxamine 5'-phosphate oxidase family protein n=1 Tax=Streptomyces TaxID=1883 RepID=UPI0029A6C447|nr:pyridoxamine 5'-phosphate oxidase family protein [Streptomyces sp. AK02-04a]MDX3763080.1 pyridoxamine 5'-phosphate oxidase family protein [Streptomyces sp. AK02-04a]
MTGIAPPMGRLDRQRCMELLERGGYGRVVFTERALPAIVPVNYLMNDGVVIGGGSAAHLPQALDGDVVAFEADGTDAASDAAWHVCVTGYAHVVTDAAQREHLARSTAAWVPAPEEVLVRITTSEVSGRSFPLTGTPHHSGRVPWPSAAGPGAGTKHR